MEHKAFIIYVATFSINLDDKMHFSKKAQIVYLKADEVLTKVLSKYIDFADVFLPILAVELFKHKKINNHTIKLVNN